ncbi:MAG: hypothetical protein R2788_15780 [Saprospiraceae bacterium]
MADRANNVDGNECCYFKIEDLDNERLALSDSLRKANPYLAKVAELNTYLSYQTTELPTRRKLNISHKIIFNYRLTDPDYEYMPGVRRYQRLGTDPSQHQPASRNAAKAYRQLIGKIPADSRTC